MTGLRPLLLALAATLAQPVAATALSISDTVTGNRADIRPFTVNVDPVTGNQVPPVPNPNYLNYGAFYVRFSNDLGATTSVVGDGVNEDTSWVFDFTDDPGYAAFAAASDPLSAARVVLDLWNPGDSAFVTDVFGVRGFNNLDIGQLTGTALGNGVYRYELDLLALQRADFWSTLTGTGTLGPDGILTAGPGMLGGQYYDDATVLSATLTLTRGQAIPSPGPLALIAVGVLGVAVVVPARRVARPR